MTDTRTAREQSEAREVMAIRALTVARSALTRLGQRVSREDRDEAATDAAVMALAMIDDGSFTEIRDAAAVAAYRVGLRCLQAAGRSREYAVGLLDTDTAVADRLSMHAPTPADPARLASTTDRDRLTAALAAVGPAALDLVTVALTYLPVTTLWTGESGRRYRPSATALADIWGVYDPATGAVSHATGGRGRTAMARQRDEAFTAVAEAMASVLTAHGREAGRDRYGANADTLAADREAKELARKRDDTVPAQVGNRPTPSSGPASAPVVRYADTPADVWAIFGGYAVAVSEDLAAYVVSRTDTLTAYARPRCPDKACTAAERCRACLLRDDDRRAEALALLTDLGSASARSLAPAPGVAPGMTHGVSGSLAGTGSALRPSAPRKRRRDGAIGGPMTRA